MGLDTSILLLLPHHLLMHVHICCLLLTRPLVLLPGQLLHEDTFFSLNFIRLGYFLLHEAFPLHSNQLVEIHRSHGIFVWTMGLSVGLNVVSQQLQGEILQLPGPECGIRQELLHERFIASRLHDMDIRMSILEQNQVQDWRINMVNLHLESTTMDERSPRLGDRSLEHAQ